MEYIVSARKYRPMSFDSVVGQSALTTTLKNAVKSGKLAHAYLFCGPRGVGKTTCARIFAKAINCEHPHDDGEACNECESCKAFNEQRSYNIFELDAASNNSVENIKALMEQTLIPPQVGRYKVFIIDEVHMLSTAAFNAFLKTLEEPPAHVIFVLATTEKHKILPTILSRCQIYDFERMTVPNTIAHLKMVADKEGITYDEQALEVIAEKADGGMRDALSIFDQAASFCQGDITYAKVIEDLNVLDVDNYFKMIDLALQNKVSDLMVLLNSVLEKGFDGGNLVNGLAAHARNVLMAKDESTLPLLEVSEQQKLRYKEQARNCKPDFIYKALKIMNQCDINYRQSSNKRLLVELTLIQVAQITQPEDQDVPVAGRTPNRLKSLFKKLMTSQPQPVRQVAGAERPLAHRLERTGEAAPVSREAAATVMPTPTARATEAAQPTAPEAQPAGGKGRRAQIKLGSVGMTFNSLLHPKKPSYRTREEEPVPLPQAEGKATSEEFTQEELEMVWLGMCNRMPESMAAMSSRMKNMIPKISTFPDIELLMDNQILLDQMQAIKGRIRSTLVKSLHNANIQLTMRLARADEVKRILTKRELFDEMRTKNPAIEKMRELLGLEMS